MILIMKYMVERLGRRNTNPLPENSFSPTPAPCGRSESSSSHPRNPAYIERSHVAFFMRFPITFQCMDIYCNMKIPSYNLFKVAKYTYSSGAAKEVLITM